MNDTKQLYESPAIDVLEVKMEVSLLQGSIEATRDGYGEAENETWG